MNNKNNQEAPKTTTRSGMAYNPNRDDVDHQKVLVTVFEEEEKPSEVPVKVIVTKNE